MSAATPPPNFKPRSAAGTPGEVEPKAAPAAGTSAAAPPRAAAPTAPGGTPSYTPSSSPSGATGSTLAPSPAGGTSNTAPPGWSTPGSAPRPASAAPSSEPSSEVPTPQSRTAQPSGDGPQRRSAQQDASQHLKSAASQQVKERVPYADKLEAGKKIADARREGGTRAAAEEAAGQGGAAAARAGATLLTGGLSDTAGAAAPQINKAIDKVGEAAGKGAFKATAAVAAAAASVAVAIVIFLMGGLTSIVGAITGTSSYPPAPTVDQCESMPENWCDVVYEAQKTTHNKSVPVPWTVLAGVARVATDFGRTSPYDTTDRDPMRETPPFLAANYAAADTAGSATGGTVAYNSGSLAWGGHSNGAIPAGALCGIPWAPGFKIECSAKTALDQLNEKYKAEHGGRSLTINSSYRDFAGQVYQRNRWCAQGACGNAAKPGTSNHGWAVAVDLGSFGAIGDFSSPNYKWMMANGPAFGWHHPPNMQAGGKGPLEPWHWEFRGTSTSGGASPQASARGVAGTVTAGLSAAVGNLSGCSVSNPREDIGGTGRQASGPFLLLPAAAKSMSDEGQNPQNPCDSAAFLALKLAETAAEVRSEDGAPDFGDTEEASAFWQKVLQRASVVADPDNPAGECTAATEGATVDQMIDAIWNCELSQADSLHVGSNVTVDGGNVSYAELDRATGQATLLAEAKAVAWASSRYGEAQCSETDATAGVFPLTAEAAASVGVAERCDQQQNIRAAAQLVIAGESIELKDRKSPAGPFGPLVGGWANIPAALGPDFALFPVVGPRTTWNPSEQCAALIDTYVVAAAGAGSPFADLARAEARPLETAKYEEHLGPWPASASSACSGATPTDLAAHAVVAAQAHLTDQPGVIVSRDDEGPLVEAPPTQGHQDADLAEEDAPLPQLAGGGPGFSVGRSPAAITDTQALLGLAAWFNWEAQEAPVATPAVFGVHSAVQRLSTTGNPAAIGPVSTGPQFAATPWTTRVTEWAIFYGGVTRPYDSHGERTGSLVASLTGISGQYAAVAGDASTQAATIIEAAKRYLGTPYAWGGGGKNGPTAGTTGIVGFDCSGLTEYAFSQAGYDIGGWTGTQKDVGTAVASMADAQPGDLLFFGSPIRHVAIYMGDNQLIHAPKPGDVVKIVAVYETPVLIKRVIEPRTATGGVDGWITGALGILYKNGFPQGANDAADLKLIIDKESSGNPAAVNKSDSNWVAGRPSFGLMQTIPTTFDAHALPGYTDKADPVAQIIAGARYAQKRYGGLANVPGVVAVRNGQPYVGY